eukprot:1190134-Prorocentrum_minimum.AAC.1
MQYVALGMVATESAEEPSVEKLPRRKNKRGAGANSDQITLITKLSRSCIPLSCALCAERSGGRDAQMMRCVPLSWCKPVAANPVKVRSPAIRGAPEHSPTYGRATLATNLTFATFFGGQARGDAGGQRLQLSRPDVGPQERRLPHQGPDRAGDNRREVRHLLDRRCLDVEYIYPEYYPITVAAGGGDYTTARVVCAICYGDEREHVLFINTRSDE